MSSSCDGDVKGLDTSDFGGSFGLGDPLVTLA